MKAKDLLTTRPPAKNTASRRLRAALAGRWDTVGFAPTQAPFDRRAKKAPISACLEQA